MTKKILFVVHRYSPYPGGSENFVRDMAEEVVRRGHTAAVFAGEHKGDLNGVRVTDNGQIFQEHWDLVVIHGGNVPLQDFIISNIPNIKAPVLFLLVRPSDSPIYLFGMQNAAFIGCDTEEDFGSVPPQFQHKIRKIRHGVDPKISTGVDGFKKMYGIKTPYMFISGGGFWPNKAMKELTDVFHAAGRDDVTLVLTGYDNRHGIMPSDEPNIRSLLIDDRNDVLSGIKEADLYIMHSFSEGYGLVLLEAMLNKTPWAARNIAGARQLKDYGFTYDSDDQLLQYLKDFKPVSDKQLKKSYNTVKSNYTTKNVVDDLMAIVP